MKKERIVRKDETSKQVLKMHKTGRAHRPGIRFYSPVLVLPLSAVILVLLFVARNLLKQLLLNLDVRNEFHGMQPRQMCTKY